MMKAQNTDRVQFLMIILYFVSIYISNTLPGGQLLTIIPIGGLLLTALLQNRGKIVLYLKGYFTYIVIFILFCSLSRLWAEDSTLAVTKINSMIFALLAMIAIVVSQYQIRDVNLLLKAIMYGGYFVCIYMFLRYGLGGIIRFLSTSTRIDNELLNANTLGMCAAYSLVIDVHFTLYNNIKPHNILMIPALIILAASGSRKAILIVVLGVIGVFVLKNTDNKHTLKNVIRTAVIIGVAIVAIYLLSKLPAFSNVTRRFMNLISLLKGNETRTTSDAWIRLEYNRLGMQLFKENPILGIGIANANIYTRNYFGHNHYLHNNYVELLACGGIVGFLIYYSAWVWLLITYIRNRKKRSKEYDICLVLLLIHLAMDYGAVTYYGKEAYFLLLVFWMEAKLLLSGSGSASSNYQIT